MLSEKLNTPSIFIETSALTGENIDDAFDKLIKMMIDDDERRRFGQERVLTATPVEDAPSPAYVANASETAETTYAEASQEISVITPSTQNEATVVESEDVAVSSEPEIDPVTSLSADSGYLEEDRIGESMTELLRLREDLEKTEEELASVTSEMETELLNLRNVIHVKRIMYDHLKKQIRQTRQEWADAYGDYTMLERRKKEELERRSREIKEIREKIEKIGKRIRMRVGELDLKKMAE